MDKKAVIFSFPDDGRGDGVVYIVSHPTKTEQDFRKDAKEVWDNGRDDWEHDGVLAERLVANYGYTIDEPDQIHISLNY